MRYAGVTKRDSAVIVFEFVTLALTSEKNPLLKQVRRAAARGELTPGGCAVAEGIHLLEEALSSAIEIETVVVAESARTSVETLLSRSDSHMGARIVAVPDSVFSKIAATEHPQGVIALVRPPEWTPGELLRGTPLIVILDAVQDPGNAGAIVRAAEAFGATGVVFLKGTVSPHNPKCLRASAGSLFRLPVARDLDTTGLKLFAAMPRAGAPIDQADFTGPCAIVIGGEGHGVDPGLAARAAGVRIPTSRVESLNAAVAAGVMLYEARRQRSPRKEGSKG